MPQHPPLNELILTKCTRKNQSSKMRKIDIDFSHLLRKNNWLRMKLTLGLVILALFQVSASTYSQTVSMGLEDVRIQRVLREIQKQTDYDFVFKSKLLDKRDLVTVFADNVPVDDILDKIIPGDLEYEIVNQTIVVKARPVSRRPSSPPEMQDIVVTGRVVDPEGEGIPAVTVLIKGTQNGTTTDIDGNYTLRVPDGYNTLIYSFLGFVTQEIEIGGRTVIDVQMEEDVTSLEEVVVNGYFITEKDSYTGTATTVTGEDLIAMGGTTLIDNLALVAPTLQVVQNNALGSNPNSIPQLRIRGESVLNTNLSQSDLLGDPNQPIFILDNFQVTIERVMDMDQSRIETVNVLRDASATALYGSRAANGVIVITTKKPQAGELLVTYGAYLDVDVADIESYDLLTGQELFDMQKELGMRSQFLTFGYETREIERLLAAGVETDWITQPVQTAYGQRHTLGIQGGNEEIRYGVDAYYTDRPGVMKGSGRTTYGAAMNLMYYPSEKLTFTNALEINFNDAQESNYGSFEYFTKLPGYFPTRNLDGTFTQVYTYDVEGTERNFDFRDAPGFFYNPLFEAQAGNLDQSGYTNFINNFNIIWQINELFRLQGTFSYTRQIDETELFVSPFSVFGDETGIGGTYDYTTTSTNRIESSVRFNFSKDFNGHAITTNTSAEVMESSARRYGFTSYGYTTDNPDPAFSLGYLPGGYPISEEATTRTVGFLGALNYSYKGRYIADFSYRLDGTSAAGANDRFAPFWSAGVGWNLHNESFMSNNDFFNVFTLRTTVGETGSIQFSPYEAITTSRYYGDYRYAGDVGSYLLGIGNPDLRWQSTFNRELALSFELWNTRISGFALYYNNLTTDVVNTIDAPPSLGFASFTENLGEIENKGFEISLQVELIKKQNMRWNVFGTANQNKDRILEIGSSLDSYNQNAQLVGLTPEEYEEALANGGYLVIDNGDGSTSLSDVTIASLSHEFLTQYVPGGSANDIWAVPSLGIDPMTGQEFFLNRFGEATTEYDPRDQVVVGNTNPTMRGTFGTNFGYKGLNVTLTFLYEFGGQIYNTTLVDKVENSDKYGNVDRRVLTKAWFEPGDVVPFKTNVSLSGDRAIQGVTQASSRFVQDNDFVQLSSMAVTYDAPRGFAQKLKMRSLRLQLNLNDILYMSTIERERGTSYPFARSFTLGVRAGF